MARTFTRRAPRRFPTRRVVTACLAVPIVVIGALAALHVADLHSSRPLVRFVIVNGESMLPTFKPGQQLLFVRRPFGLNDVVIADVGEDESVVKRVVKILDSDHVRITGDNTKITATYDLPRDKIIATLLMPTGLQFAPPPETKPHKVPDRTGQYTPDPEVPG